MTTDFFIKLKKEVIDEGICTHCGTCVGLFPEKLSYEETVSGPLPSIKKGMTINDKKVYDYCPAISIKYKELNKFTFGKDMKDFILGNLENGYIGYAKDENVRRAGASGGVTTAILLYLLDKGLIDGAVVLKQGIPKPWLATPIIATTAAEIKSCSQSVYIPIMVNSIIPEIRRFKGNLAFVGLPDQVAAIRKLQMGGDKDLEKIKYVFGPYVGTGIYLESIKSFLRSNGARNFSDIKSMKYRDGEWPGYLRIDTKDGRTLKASKFYYNYLIPFYVTTSSLIAVDFTNELTDISVGDAWSPKYESKGQGFSVVLARNKKADHLLKDMEKEGKLSLNPEKRDTLINMHGHMIDFKKRGSFIRMKWMRFFGKHTPYYDYSPVTIGISRYFVELVISGLFFAGRFGVSRWVIEKLPLSFVGSMFNFFRKSWKGMSRSTKRKGIKNIKFKFTGDD